jgi:hypothetical protein
VRTKLRFFAAVFATGALGMLVAGTGVAAAGGKDKKTLRVVAEEIQTEFLDLGDPGPSLGDQIVFSEALFIRGEEVGESGGVCTVTKASPPYDVLTFQCVATLSLERGQITVQGLNESQGEDDPGPVSLAITGGTGKYRGAGGEAVFRRVGDERGVYTLRFDSSKNHHKKKHRRH